MTSTDSTLYDTRTEAERERDRLMYRTREVVGDSGIPRRIESDVLSHILLVLIEIRNEIRQLRTDGSE